MSIYIGNDLEDRFKTLETENVSLKKYNEYHRVVHEIDHMSDLHVDSSFHKQSIEIDNYLKIMEWIDSSICQSTVIQELEVKRSKLSSLNQTENRRYVNFENGSHFICSLNFNNPELTVFIAFKMTGIASGNQDFVNNLIGNKNGSHFICILNLNNPELTIFITFTMIDIASGDQDFVNSLIGNTDGKINAKHITFYRTNSGLGLLISKAHGGASKL